MSEHINVAELLNRAPDYRLIPPFRYVRLTVAERDALVDVVATAIVLLEEAIGDDHQIHSEWGVGPYNESPHITRARKTLAKFSFEAAAGAGENT